MRTAPLGLLVVLTLAACGSEGRSAAPGPSTTTTTTTEAPAPSRATDGVVELVLEVPAEVEAGERVWATLTTRNVGDRPVWWQGGGCGTPGGVELVSGGDVAGFPPKWDGDPAHLAERTFPAGPFGFRPEGAVGLAFQACTADSLMKPLRPGDEHVQRLAADLRLGPGAVPDVRAVATFRSYAEADDYGGPDSVGPRPDVVVEAPIEVVDQPATADAALEAFAADPGLAAFVDETRSVENVTQSWYAQLAWWRGGWELTVSPEYGNDPRGQSRYRLRAVDGEVVDARRIWWDQSPEDDPGGTRFRGAPPDDVRPR